MYFVVMPNRSHSKHLGIYCIVMPALFVNCPAVICLPNIASYLRETPLVICGLWSYLYILFTTPAAIICFLLLARIPAIFHTLLLTLCSARPERLTISLFRVGQSSSLFLCRFHVVEGTTVNQAQALSSAWGGVITNNLSIDHQVLLVRLNVG